jgi:uncharacterized HhH-GPD family protein
LRPRSWEQSLLDGEPRSIQARFVAAALLEFGDRLIGQANTRLVSESSADSYVRSHPFAFLVAVLLDQGIPAERAWAAPSVLRARLGHLEPARLVMEPDRVEATFQRSPKPHRFPRVASRWVLEGARRVVRDYQGDAARIWADGPTAAELRRRLEEFPGIGQKKAAMAVEILVSDLGVPVADLSGSDVAYDVHVRRVFVRTGLAPTDSLRAVVAAAREVNPSRPGALDVPAWTVGRHWCRPRRPICTSCPIAWACPLGPLPTSRSAPSIPFAPDQERRA